MPNRRIPWTRQPQGPALVDRSGRLFDPTKLSAVIAPGSGSYLIDALSGKNYTVTTNPAKGVSSLGQSIAWAGGTNDYIELTTDADDVLDTVNCSILIATVRTSASTGILPAYGYQVSASERAHLHIPYSDNNLYWDFGNATAGSGRLSVSIASYLAAGTINIWGFSAGSRGREIWRNGVLLASNSSATASRTLTAAKYRVGAVDTASAAACYHTDALFALSKEQWSQNTFKELTNNPNLVFAPQERKVFSIAASSAVVRDLTTAALTFVGQDTQNTAAATLSAAGSNFAAQDTQNTLATTLTAGGLTFVGQDTQNTVAVTLSTATMDSVALSITAENLGASVNLDVATFGMVAQDAQNTIANNLDVGVLNATTQDIQLLNATNLNVYALDFTAKDTQNAIVDNLDAAILYFTSRSITFPGQVATGGGTHLMLMGVGP